MAVQNMSGSALRCIDIEVQPANDVGPEIVWHHTALRDSVVPSGVSEKWAALPVGVPREDSDDSSDFVSVTIEPADADGFAA